MKIAGLQITSGAITENSSIGSTVSIAGVNVSGTTFLPTTSGDIAIGIAIATSAFVSTNYAVTANQAINFDTILYDTASGVIQANGMITVGAANTWKFTAPVKGIYDVIGVTNLTTAANAVVLLYKNSVSTMKLGINIGATNQNSYTFGGSIQLNANDTISINLGSSVSVVGGSTPYDTMVTIKRVR